MGKGKIGAQCAHAAVAVVERVADSQPHVLDAWEENGQAKICLRADSTATLVRVFEERARREVKGRTSVDENDSLRMLRLQVKVGHEMIDTGTADNTTPHSITSADKACASGEKGRPASLPRGGCRPDAGRSGVKDRAGHRTWSQERAGRHHRDAQAALRAVRSSVRDGRY